METENGCGLQYCSEAAFMLIFVSSCRGHLLQSHSHRQCGNKYGKFLDKGVCRVHHTNLTYTYLHLEHSTFKLLTSHPNATDIIQLMKQCFH